MADPTAHDPSHEAADAAGPGYTVRVLEPSPPPVDEPPFFADDPAATGEPDPGTLIVTPHQGGDLTWDELVAERPDLSDFAAGRWLGARRPLTPVPGAYVDGMLDFHRVAFSVVGEARRVANTKFGLRYTRGGFGTPFFGSDRQVRIEGDLIVVQEGDSVRFEPLTTLRAAGAFAGVEPGVAAAEHDSPDLGDIDRELATSHAIGSFLGDWFGFATAVLEELRATEGVVDAARVQLWPGHFDPATAAGADGGRATFGFSPGDGTHGEPYIYVAAFGEVDRSNSYWNEVGFAGSSMPYSELLVADDAFERARGFLLTGYGLLNP